MRLAEFYNATRNARKIILVDLGFLGDAIHTIPACWELHRHYPDAELHTVFAPVGAEVLALVPCIHRSWAWPRTRSLKDWRSDLGRWRELRQQHFDLALNFSGADRPLLITGFSGAPWRVAYPGDRRHIWARWLIPRWMSRQPRNQPVFEQRRRALAECGFSLAAPQFGLRVPDEALAAAARWVPPNAVHVSISASGPLKEWPLPHWISFARAVLAEFPELRIVATGAAAEREQTRLREFAAGVHHPRLVQIPPGGSVALLAAILRGCRLHVGADSGALHLAAALGIPCLAFFRDYEGTIEWAPTGSRHRILKRPCPCDINRYRQPVPACGFAGPARCLADISVTEALEAFRAVLRESAATTPG